MNQAISGPPPRMMPALVGRHALVALERHAAGGQFVDGLLDVGHREVEHRERRRRVVGLGVDEHLGARAEVQPEHAAHLRHRR